MSVPKSLATNAGLGSKVLSFSFKNGPTKLCLKLAITDKVSLNLESKLNATPTLKCSSIVRLNGASVAGFGSEE